MFVSVTLALFICAFSPCVTGAVISLPEEMSLKGSCQCAVFRYDQAEVHGEPLVMKNTEIEMATDKEGKQECSELCVALAEANKDEGPKVLCEAVKTDVDHLQVAVSYRLLKEPWVFTGKTNSIPICCKSGAPIPCIGCSTIAS